MKIKVPPFAEDITDEGMLTFLAFCYRVCEVYGYNTEYYIDIDDVSNLCDKAHPALPGWLQNDEIIAKNIKIGKPLDRTISFSLSKPPSKGFINNSSIEKHLTDPRQQMVWVYILGCFNHNLIAKEPSKRSDEASIREYKIKRGNTSDLFEFRLSRDRMFNGTNKNIFVEEFYESTDD
jgi:hypothetical protein